MYIDATEHKGQIIVWTRDKSGQLDSFVEPAPYYCYHEEDNGAYRTIFNHRVNKIEFDSRVTYRDYVENHSNIFESDISPVQKFLSDKFYKIDGPVNKGYFDIEIDFDLTDNRGYPSPENPFGKINAISLFDEKRNTYHMFMLTDKSIEIIDDVEGLPVVNHCCVTEKQLLDHFFRAIEDIDVLSSWNGEKFDIPYIINRSEILYGSAEGRAKMCRDGFQCTMRDYTDDYGIDRIKFGLVGRSHLDLMDIYKKFTRNTKGEMPSYKLDSIVEKELGMNKRVFAGDLGRLYRSDPKAFFEYSLHDSRLLKMLDAKLKFLNLAITMSRRATIRFDEVLGSIRYLEMSIRNHCHFDRDEVVILPDRTENKKGEFEGAFVMEPATGVYGWTQSIDIGSLYPNCICSLNISPETHVMQCENGHEDFLQIAQATDVPVTIYSLADKEKMVVKAKDVNQFLRNENFTISANGSVFNNNFIGIIPEVLNIWKKQRKELKQKGIQARKDGNIELADYCDVTQDVLKVGLNSLYGTISNPWSRFYTLDCAKSVTITGQEIAKYQAYMADYVMAEKLAA